MLKNYKSIQVKSILPLEKIIEYLMYLLPITLVSGSFLSDLSVSLIAIFFLLIACFSNQMKYFKNNFFLIFMLWSLYLIIGSIFSENPFLSLESSLFFWRFGLFSLAVWYLLDNIIYFKRNFFFVLLITFVFLTLDSFLQFVTGFNLIGYTYYTVDGQRISGMFGDEAILGNFISRMLPILIALFLSFNKNFRIYSFASALLILLSGALILISGERTAFIYFLIFLFLVMFLANNYKYEKLFIFLISIVICTILFTSNNSIKQRMILNTMVELNIEKGISLNNIVPKNYIPIYESALKIFFDKPYTGVGTKMFRDICSKKKYFVNNGCSTHPHNTYLQMLAETGVIGIIPVLSLFLYLTFLYIKHIVYFLLKSKIFLHNEKILMMSSIFITTFPFLPSLNFFHNWYSIITFLPVGFLLHMINKEKY